MVPELSVVSPKRFASGDLTEAKLVAILARYQPEQLLLHARKNERHTALVEQFKATHLLHRKFPGYEQWVKADLLPARRREALVAASVPSNPSPPAEADRRSALPAASPEP